MVPLARNVRIRDAGIARRRASDGDRLAAIATSLSRVIEAA